MSAAIIASYNDAISVSFRSDAWFNATQVGRQFGKKPDNWLRNDDTKAYIRAFSQMCDFEENQLVSIKRGNPEHGGGTWMHPKLGVAYARWLDPKFGVWCDLQVEKILYPQDATKSLESPTITASEQQTLSEIVARRANECAEIGKAKAEIWSRVHRKFRVAKYQQLPRELLSDAIAYVMQMEVKTPSAPEITKAPTYSAPLSLWHLSNRAGTRGWLTYKEMQRVEAHERPLAVLLSQIKADGHDVEGAQAEYKAIQLLLEVYYWRLSTMADVCLSLDRAGLNIPQH